MCLDALGQQLVGPLRMPLLLFVVVDLMIKKIDKKNDKNTKKKKMKK